VYRKQPFRVNGGRADTRPPDGLLYEVAHLWRPIMKPMYTIVLFLTFFSSTALHAQYANSNRMLSLGGAGYLSVPFSSALNYDLLSSNQLSIDAWIRPTSTGTRMTIVGNDMTFSYWFGLTPQGKLRFDPNPGLTAESNASIQLNTWTHVAVSFNASANTMRFYINGSLDRTINTMQSYIGYGYNDLRIGADRTPNSPAYYWVGLLDEVRVWDAALDFSTAAGLLYRIPHGIANGRFGRNMKGGWRLNGSGVSVDGNVNASPVGTIAWVSSPAPPHYSRISVVFSNGPNDDDRILIPHSTALGFTQNYTLECWVRPASGGNTQYQTFIGKGSYDASNWQFWLGLNKSNGRVRFVPTGNWGEVVEGPNAIPLNTWTHVAARFQQLPTGGRVAVLFLNGVEVARRSYVTAANATTSPMFFGSANARSGGHVGYGYSGSLDEVRVWNVARSDDQIADHHRMELDGPLPGLVGSWHFDGDDLDASGNALNGIGGFSQASNAWFMDASTLPSLPALTLIYPAGGERWAIGSTQRIRWTAVGVPNVTIELSRNGGATFPEVLSASEPAGNGQFDWQVIGPETFDAVVRVRPPSTQLLAQTSKAVTIEAPIPMLDVAPRQLVFTANPGGPAPPAQMIYISNVGGAQLNWTATPSQGLWLDVSPMSGKSNDDSVSVNITNTKLPVGQYQDRITIGGNAGNAGLQVSIIYNVVPAISYTLSGVVRDNLGNGITGIQIALAGTESQSTITGPKGEYSFPGLSPGDYNVTPVSLMYDFAPSSRTYSPLTTNYSDVNFEGRLLRGDVVIRFDAGWNLISLPMDQSGVTVASLFPQASSPAYEYVPTEGYVEAKELEFGKGYWLKFDKTDSVLVSGVFSPVVEVSLSGQFGGWALLGAPSGPVPLSNIIQAPASSLLSVYGYNPGTGYFIPADGVLRPGRGYFVKVSTDAVLRLIAGVLSSPIYRLDW
jgi:hypothetical protein